MFSKPINSSLRIKVNTILKSAKRKADKAFAENIASKTKDLDDFESLKIIDREYKALKKKIKRSAYPFYIENSSTPEWLLTQFASRTYLLNIDESNELEEAIYLGKYRSNISKNIVKILKKIPSYSYEQFVNGEVCRFFLFFKEYKNIAEDDYYKIIKWQSENIINIISYESSMLIKKIQIHCQSIDSPELFISSQRSIIEDLFTYNGSNACEIKNKLSTLYIFQDFNFENFESASLLENFKIYKNEEFHWHKADYNMIKPVADYLLLKPESIFTNDFLVFQTIDKIAVWFGQILKGRDIQNDYIFPDYSKEFDRVKNEAQEEIERVSDLLYDFINDETNTEKEIKDYFLNLYDSYRIRLNHIKDKDILQVISNDKEYILIDFFTTNAFFSNDVEKVSEHIKELMVIHELSWDILVAYNNFFDTKNIYDTQDYGVSDITMLLNKMVLNKKLYKASKKAMDDFFLHFQKYSLPFDYHIKNVQELLVSVFSIALKNLQEILDDAEPTNKVIFLQSRIKEIKQRELQFKQIESEYIFDSSRFRYTELLKEFLMIEADFLKETMTIRNILPAPQIPPKLDLTPTFENIVSREHQIFITQMMEDLCITFNGKSVISERKKGAIRGIVEALKESRILPDKSLESLCRIIGKKINLDINSKLDFSNISEKYRKEACLYIAQNYRG